MSRRVLSRAVLPSVVSAVLLLSAGGTASASAGVPVVPDSKKVVRQLEAVREAAQRAAPSDFLDDLLVTIGKILAGLMVGLPGLGVPIPEIPDIEIPELPPIELPPVEVPATLPTPSQPVSPAASWALPGTV